MFVVGAGNSAEQAALHPARLAARVTILARGDTLDASMSDYLVGEIGATPNIDVRTRTGIAGGGALRPDRRRAPHRLSRRDGGARRVRLHPYQSRTGVDRPDCPLLETSLPGVIAAGDVRHGSVKRVAAAVEEGSVAITSVHQHLRDRASPHVAGAGRG